MTSTLSTVPSGPIAQLQRRPHITPRAAVALSVLAAVFLCWAVPMALAVAAFMERGTWPPLVAEAGFHVRFLLTVPLLFIAKAWFDRRTTSVAGSFVQRRLLDVERAASWTATKRRLERLGAGPLAELGVAAFVVVIHLLDYYGVREAPLLRWLAPAVRQEGSLAQSWYAVVSQPVMLFVLVRWLWRWLLWSAAVASLSRTGLALDAKHPDRAGGLAFLSIPLDSYQLVAFAVGSALAATWGDRILATGVEASVLAPHFVIFVLIAVVVGVWGFAPLTPLMLHARRRDTKRYAIFASDYLHDFRNKWLTENPPSSSPLGVADVQSLADLGVSYSVATEMRMTVPSTRDVMRVIGIATLPTLVLLARVTPAEEIAKRLLLLVLP